MFGIDDIIGAGLKILDKVIPDPAAKAAAQAKLLQMKQAGDLAFLDADVRLAEGQMRINEAEAKTGSAGWRHKVGMLCVYSLGYAWIGHPAMVWLVALVGAATGLEVPIPPAIDPAMQYGMLTGMLGLGGARSFDLLKGSRI